MPKMQRQNNRTSKLLYRQAEEWLRTYEFDKALLKERREYIKSTLIRSSSDFKALSELGCHIDGSPECCALEKMLEVIESDKVVIRLSNRIERIEAFLDNLDMENRLIMELRYIKHNSLHAVADAVHLSFETVRSQRIPANIWVLVRQYLFIGY